MAHIKINGNPVFVSVTKTNLAVHEDKNRVPFVKVRTFIINKIKFDFTGYNIVPDMGANAPKFS